MLMQPISITDWLCDTRLSLIRDSSSQLQHVFCALQVYGVRHVNWSLVVVRDAMRLTIF